MEDVSISWARAAATSARRPSAASLARLISRTADFSSSVVIGATGYDLSITVYEAVLTTIPSDTMNLWT